MGLAFACSAAADGAIDVHVRHDGQATLQRWDDLGGCFRAIVFERMQHRKQHARMSDGLLRAVQAAKPEQHWSLLRHSQAATQGSVPFHIGGKEDRVSRDR